LKNVEHPTEVYVLNPAVEISAETGQKRHTATTVVTGPLAKPRWFTPLIDRTTQLSRLKTAFENALMNISSVIALQGEPGIGKSRLMQEFAAYANERGAVTLTGRAYQGNPPYGVWVEVTRQYTSQATGRLLRRMLGPNASELVRLVPDIAVKVGTIPPPRTSGQDKTQFYEAVTQFFIAIIKSAPLLLLFEDTQYLDQPSSELWEYVVRRTENLPILNVCAIPPEREIDSASQLEQVLTKFNRERLLETIPLKGLNRDETSELINQTFGEQTITPEFADLIYQRTGGNPFFVEEVLRSLVADGTLFRTEKGWDRKSIDDIVVPRTVKTVLRNRLGKLDAETAHMLQWAAVIGSEFDYEVLKRASELSEDKLLLRLETANSQGLIMEISNKSGKFRFVDERIRDLILEEIMQLKRRKLHAKIAEAIEDTYVQSRDSQAETIALHFAEAGDKEKTIKYSIMAADYGRSIHAYDQAAGSYLRALGLVDEASRRASIIEKLADCYHNAGQHPKSVESYQKALDLYESLKDYASCARISTQLAIGIYRVKGAETALQFMKEAMKYVQSSPESYEAAGLFGWMAVCLSLLDRHDEANTWSQKALKAGEKSGNFAATSDALHIMGSFFLDTGRIDDGLPLLERSLEVAKQHNLYDQSRDALLILAGYSFPRQLPKAREYASQWLALAKQENDLYSQANATVWLAFMDWLHGDWSEASREFESAFELKNRLGFRFPALNAEAQRARLHISLGELEKAEEYCRNAVERHDDQIYHIVATNLALGELRLEQGRMEEAKAHFEACVSAFKDHEFTTLPLWHVETLLHLATIYLDYGRIDDAGSVVDWAKRLAQTLKSDACLAMVAQAEASLLLRKGDRRSATEACLAALELWKKTDWPYYYAKALAAYSETMAQTNHEESKKHLQQAMEIFKKLGAKRDLEKVKERLSAGF
jgi:tetratricopeptide (TPR) repeat protein